MSKQVGSGQSALMIIVAGRGEVGAGRRKRVSLVPTV